MKNQDWLVTEKRLKTASSALLFPCVLCVCIQPFFPEHGSYINHCSTVRDHAFVFVKTIQQDQPVHTCSLILLGTIRYPITSFSQRNERTNERKFITGQVHSCT